MWFLIRSVFWLSIVFAFLPWPENSLIGQISAALQSGAKAAIMAAIDEARTTGASACAKAPAACLEAAARLGQFAAGSAASLSVGALSAEAKPKPPPRPAEPR
ncbi:conserved hypothetical protein [Methylocella silvestris BL2]|uniref:Uncharacterized protein n=1 Tax=Methylocella silvestris (strain DSM 15510 / CIP 108128 / LMG 27833 / NCIMB 13906 / BL2) TaxID=395965 RepID=B8EK79_METSB|nr:hypothetical protein [Methylocella silvestris]ACK50619.1 conserved hypothetical protein [Methylocella silvestris BL2]